MIDSLIQQWICHIFWMSTVKIIIYIFVSLLSQKLFKWNLKTEFSNFFVTTVTQLSFNLYKISRAPLFSELGLRCFTAGLMHDGLPLETKSTVLVWVTVLPPTCQTLIKMYRYGWITMSTGSMETIQRRYFIEKILNKVCDKHLTKPSSNGLKKTFISAERWEQVIYFFKK